MPQYIRKELARGDINNNIFTHTSKPYNNSYFKGVWRRFKKRLPSVERDITLYSFRHTGAIEIYKRTGSLSKLQKAMGHSHDYEFEEQTKFQIEIINSTEQVESL